MQEKKIKFDNGNGLTLVGKLVMPNDHAPIVILCHGFTSQKENGKNVALASTLVAHGIGSLRFDFFAHGESDGQFSEITLSEGVKDVRAAYRYVQDHFPGNAIAFYGSSYGGAACYFATPGLHIAGMALVCPALYYYQRKKQTIGTKKLQEWQKKGIMTYTNFDGKKFKLKYAFLEDLAKHDPEKVKQTAPILIIHGDKDETVPVNDSKKIAKLIPSVNVSVYKGANHYFREPEMHQRLVDEVTIFFTELFTVPHAHR